ncbi:MAG: UDP-glucose 4-epimerase GalE, partial [Proteobacteria bacterium]|nr:UDP-glucose 4-epimerase GalE [Pseudomonadota bacterium]
MKTEGTVKPETVLVTGGCGYIGSHVARQLSAAGHKPVILDNLSTGFRELLAAGEILIEGNCADQGLVSKIIRDFNITTVMHFAASTVVPESVANPVKYYKNNVAGSLALIEASIQAGVKNFIFSSTGSVYGEAAPVPVAEHHRPEPTNPYSRSKLITETMLKDIAAVTGLRYAILRYFNVAGADPEGRQGQKSKNATHLIKIASEVACGKRKSLSVFGTDYDTP